MAVTLTLSDDPRPDDGLRSLRTFLLTQPQYRGRVAAAGAPVAEGVLGSTIESLQVAFGSGAAGAFGGVLIAWIRSRAGKYTVHLKRKDGSEFTLTCGRVRAASVAEIAELTEQINGFVSGGD
jgi:hypothetical protein